MKSVQPRRRAIANVPFVIQTLLPRSSTHFFKKVEKEELHHHRVELWSLPLPLPFAPIVIRVGTSISILLLGLFLQLIPIFALANVAGRFTLFF